MARGPAWRHLRRLELIRALWAEWPVGGDGLNTWLKRTLKVESLRFVTAADAPKAITGLKALKAMKALKALKALKLLQGLLRFGIPRFRCL